MPVTTVAVAARGKEHESTERIARELALVELLMHQFRPERDEGGLVTSCPMAGVRWPPKNHYTTTSSKLFNDYACENRPALRSQDGKPVESPAVSLSGHACMQRRGPSLYLGGRHSVAFRPPRAGDVDSR